MNSICTRESTDTYLLRETYYAALKHRNSIATEAANHGMPKDSIEQFSNFFIESYPDKVVNGDFALIKAIAQTALKLQVEKNPLLIVSRLPEKYKPSMYSAIVAFGFSSGLPLTYSSSEQWFNRDVRVPILAGQAISCFGKIAPIADYTQSFGVSNWGAVNLQHAGSYLFRRSYEISTEVEPDPNDKQAVFRHQYEPEMYVTYTHKAADVRVGNNEIEAFIEENPLFSEIIDGCRDAYRNNGLNPLLGKSIARDFKLDIPDKDAAKLRWI